MKKILYLLLLLPSILFGQVNGKLILDKPSGYTIVGDTLKFGALDLAQTTASQTFTLNNFTSGTTTVYISNIGSTSITMSPGGILAIGKTFIYKWTGGSWNVCSGVGTVTNGIYTTTSAGGDLTGTYPNPTLAIDRMRALVPTAVKTTTYSASANDFVPCDNTSGSFTITLPNAPVDRTVFAVKMIIQGGANTLTIACAGSDVINKAGGITSFNIPYLGQGYLLQYKSSLAIWYVLADDLPKSALDAIYAPIASPTFTGTVTVPSGSVLATPTSVTLTNATGLPLTTGVTGVLPIANGGSQWTTTGSDIYYNTGKVGIGNTIPAVKLHVAETSTAQARGAAFDQNSTDANGSAIWVRKSRGTFASPATIVTGDTIGGIRFGSYDGANFIHSANIRSRSVGTIGTNRTPSVLEFSTMTNVSTGVLTKALTLDQSQNAQFAGNITAGTWQGSLVAGTYGGTGVNNGSNLLTVPATGTAALLESANVFTANQTLTLSQNAITKYSIANVNGNGAAEVSFAASNGSSSSSLSTKGLAFASAGLYSAFQTVLQAGGTGSPGILYASLVANTYHKWSIGGSAAGNQIMNLLTTGLSLTPTAQSSGTTPTMTFTQAAHTGGAQPGLLWTAGLLTSQTTATEITDINYNLSAVLKSVDGTIATQRAFRIQGRTYTPQTTALTITDAASFEVNAATAGSGTTITRNWAARLLGNVAIGNSLYVGTSAGTTAPTALIHLAAGTATANTAPLKYTPGTPLTTPEAGTSEYDGSNFYFSPSTTRKRISLTNNATPSNGQIGIGNGTDYTVANITSSGGSITVTNGSGTIDISTSQTLASGTFTPTLTNVTNVTASTAYVTGYFRIGSSVTVYGKVAINSTLAASTATEVGISLPVASNLAAEEDLGGTAVSDALASETARIKADATNDRASVTFKSISISNDSYSFEFSYQVK